MALNISVQQAISWLNGKGDENTILGIKEAGILTYLENISTTFLSSRSPYSGTLQGSGTLMWKLPHLAPTKNYSMGQTIGQNTREVPNWDYITSGAIVRRSGVLLNEYFDYRMVAPEQAVATVNQIVGSLSLSAAADTNAAFWTAIKKYYDAHPEQTMYLPNLTARKVLTDAEARELVVQMAHKRNDLTLIYDSKSYGIRPEQFHTIINGAGAINLSQTLVMLNQSVSAFEVAKSLINNPFGDKVANPNGIIGNKIIIDNMLDLSVAKNVAWSEDEDFDTKGLLGSIQFQDFIAFPTLEPAFGVREVPNTLNHNYIIEYARTHAFLRPKLACGIVNTFKAFAKDTDLVEIATDTLGYEVKVGGKLNLGSNLYFADDNTTFTSSGGSATISGKVLTGVTTGTVVITAKNEDFTTTFKVKVVAA